MAFKPRTEIRYLAKPEEIVGQKAVLTLIDGTRVVGVIEEFVNIQDEHMFYRVKVNERTREIRYENVFYILGWPQKIKENEAL